MLARRHLLPSQLSLGNFLEILDGFWDGSFGHPALVFLPFKLFLCDECSS